jgi:hypothetical protein
MLVVVDVLVMLVMVEPVTVELRLSVVLMEELAVLDVRVVVLAVEEVVEVLLEVVPVTVELELSVVSVVELVD